MSRARWGVGMLVAIAGLVAASCGVEDPDDATASADPPPTDVAPAATAATPAAGPTPSPAGSSEPAMRALVDLAVADLAGVMGSDPSDVVVVSADAVTWPDRSLGCPLPDMRYEQVPTDGALIVLSVDGSLFRYHSGGSRPPFLCTAKE